MSFIEVERAVLSKKRIEKREAQEKAKLDYILADLIGRSIARIYSSTVTYPDIHEVYPNLFDNKQYEEEKQKRQDEVSALRFKQFAQAFNNKMNKEVGNNG